MATYWCVEIGRTQSTGHFSFETFVCIMAKSQIKFGLRDRQIFSRAKKPCKHWKKDVNNLPMAFDTRLWHERKITCPEQDSDLRLPVTSGVWYPLHHRVNHAGYMITYRCVENIFLSTHLCVPWLNPKLISGYVTDIFSRAKKAISFAVAIFKRPAGHREASKFLARYPKTFCSAHSSWFRQLVPGFTIEGSNHQAKDFLPLASIVITHK